jgi:hypothetical protein
MKNIIKRNLSLSQKYLLLDTKYISLIDGSGCTCDNCGKLIANIATISGETDQKSYSIGFDCLETFLINNHLLSGEDIELFNTDKKCLPRVKKESNWLKDFLNKNQFIKTVKIEYKHNWITYNFFNETKQVWNDGSKAKDFNINMLLNTLKRINKGVNFELI